MEGDEFGAAIPACFFLLAVAWYKRDGVSPILHIMFHGTVENQLAADNPRDVRLVLQALQRQGLNRLEAIRRIAIVQSGEVFLVLKEQRPSTRLAPFVSCRS